MPPRHVHILFVHGVGTQARLSSLLRPFQSLRTDLTSGELPAQEEENLIRGWELESFDDLPLSPCVVLRQRPGQENPAFPRRVIFHEVNYSHLAGVVRENHPLDMTQLFVGFNLSVALARRGLDFYPPESDVAGLPPDAHRKIARRAQKLAGILVSATVPVLGVVPLLAGSLGADSIVSTFKRFFEDIATFTMDSSGFDLISKHLDQTTRDIRTRRDFNAEDELIVAAHSLGSVVAHSHLVRNWEQSANGPPPMDRFLTFGAPISLLCWLWLFLDFFRMDVATSVNNRVEERVFAWRPVKPGASALHPIQWLNAVNFMDPIAAGIPQEFVFMGAAGQTLRAGLAGGGIDQRFLRPDRKSGPFPHRAYLADRPTTENAHEAREMFVNILRDFAGLRELPSPAAVKIDARTHWGSLRRRLLAYRLFASAGGVLLMIAFLRGVCSPERFFSPSGWRPLVPFLPYLIAPLPVGLLAFFQNLLWGGPTKRVREREFAILPWTSPFALHLKLVPLVSPIARMLDRVLSLFGLSARFAGKLLSLVPFLLASLLPWWILRAPPGGLPPIPSMSQVFLGLGLMTASLLLFLGAEFLGHWRAILKVVFLQRDDRRD